MTTEQRAELERLTAALGPMEANAPRSNEFRAVRTVTKLVKILVAIALDADAPAPPTPGRGIVRHIKGPRIP